MTPLHPDFRQALKDAHPGLTDDIIDEYERLTAMRHVHAQQNFKESMEEMDRKREELLKSRMPHYAQVAQAVGARSKAGTPETGTQFKVEIIPDDGKQGGR
jgi:hypothetical protein